MNLTENTLSRMQLMMVETEVHSCMQSTIWGGLETMCYVVKIKPHPNFTNHTHNLVNLSLLC